ncbi:hypothetical protein MGLY_08720 [Neomoorella glycerini]|uniref:Phosphotransferase system enzyme I N-terminal domain-containing protein n=1 Tax=Neomoorella glycerini TaxID=55779 RepID=A0A6I5ZP33_9FIRM|nr:phosphoenolpyruvate-utilizing N-terminal domain-containing protein [Moorella glycerini]QGP91536.1 hypothetical protein MGLY_08720 [Moorella glycerini]
MLKGIAATPGIGIGPVYMIEMEPGEEENNNSPFLEGPEEIQTELARLEEALGRAKRDLEEVAAKTRQEIGETLMHQRVNAMLETACQLLREGAPQITSKLFIPVELQAGSTGSIKQIIFFAPWTGCVFSCLVLAAMIRFYGRGNSGGTKSPVDAGKYPGDG